MNEKWNVAIMAVCAVALVALLAICGALERGNAVPPRPSESALPTTTQPQPTTQPPTLPNSWETEEI